LLSLLALTCALALVPVHVCDEKAADDHYIVLFHHTLAPNCSSVEAIQEWANVKLGASAKIVDAWQFVEFFGFSGILLGDSLDRVRALPEVRFIEENCVVRIPKGEMESAGKPEFNGNRLALPADLPGYGQYRSDQCSQTSLSSRPFNPAASNSALKAATVNIYVVDTGVSITHEQFGGRAKWGISYVTPVETTDNNGHGTHCAGTAAGGSTSTYTGAAGYATQATIISVQVLNRQGSGTNANVISGINYVATQSRSGTFRTVMSMSLGGGFSQPLNDAVNNCVAANVVAVVAAGNDNANAANYSPASAASAICVGAITSTNARATYSNFGTPLTVFAPGSSIKSSWIGANDAYNTISGTSMACPAVAGIVAGYLAANPTATPAQVKTALVNSATNNAVTSPGTGSPNKIAYDRFTYGQNPAGCA